jgi:small subunit ribosomal protein S16
MAVKIRLRKQGRVNSPFYRLVVTDGRSPRDGKYVEAVGWFNPRAQKEQDKCAIDVARVQYWVSKGAQCSDKVLFLLKQQQPAAVIAPEKEPKKAKTKKK